MARISRAAFPFLVLFTASFAVGSFAPAGHAATDPLDKCQQAKLKALQTTAKKVFTCTGSELKKNAVAISTFDANCISSVNSKFAAKWDKAIEKAAKKGVSCFNAPGPVTVADGATTAATDVSAILRAGFNAGDDANPVAVKSLNDLMKTSESYATKLLSLEASNAIKPNPTKLATGKAKAAASLSKKFAAQEVKVAKKGIVLSANDSSVLAALDAWVGTLASDIQSNPIFPLGQFQDSAAQGVGFAPALDASGGNVTVKGGWFPITSGSMTFSIGATTLGTATVGSVVTPVSLVPGATDELNATVTNIAKLLQTLDEDANPKNGITLSPAVQQAALSFALNVAQTINAFQVDGTVANAIAQLTALTRKGSRPLVTTAAAQAHLSATLITQLAGDYAGTYSGTDVGTWTAKISKKGAISGKGRSIIDGSGFTFRGSVGSNGIALFGNTSSGASFVGTVSGGVMSGSWINSPDSGTFTGTLQ